MNGKNFIQTTVCIHKYKKVFVYQYMDESIDKVKKQII